MRLSMHAGTKHTQVCEQYYYTKFLYLSYTSPSLSSPPSLPPPLSLSVSVSLPLHLPLSHTKLYNHAYRSYAMHPPLYTCTITTRAYRLQRRRGHVTSSLAKFKSRLRIVEFLNIHSAVQKADITIISYKPLSDLNLARYTQHYGSYTPSSPLESISP